MPSPTNPELLLVRGLPGAGKSTFARHFSDAGWVHLEADQYFIEKDGTYVFDESRLRDAHAWCLRKAKAALCARENVVVSNTFVTLSELEPYQGMAAKAGARLTVVKVEGAHASEHAVPEAVLADMRARWESL